MSHNYFRHKKHIGILNPDEPKKHINIKMPKKMDERDIQNIVYPCCGLMEIRKWGVQHNRYYGGSVEARIIEESAQKCERCGAFVGTLFNSYDTMKNIMGRQTFKFVRYVEIHILPKWHWTAILH